MMFEYTWRMFLALCIALFVGACSSTPTATTDYDSRDDFSGVRKIAIQPVNRASPSTVIISDMQIERVNEALTTELERRGFSVVMENADADMLLVWHLVTQERTDIRSFNSTARYNCWNCAGSSNVTVRQYTQGSFFVAMIVPVILRSVWRSIIESRMRNQTDPERAAPKREEAARAIFANFPPGASG